MRFHVEYLCTKGGAGAGDQRLPDFSGVTLWWMNRRWWRCAVDGTQVPELFLVGAVNHRPDADVWLAFLQF